MSCGTVRSVPALAFSTLSTLFLTIPLFFLLCTCPSGEAFPLFGSLLSSLGSSTTANGTSILQVLVLDHLQDKFDNMVELVGLLFG